MEMERYPVTGGRLAFTVSLDKGKGNKNYCNNYRDKLSYCTRTSVWKNLDREVDIGCWREGQ